MPIMTLWLLVAAFLLVVNIVGVIWLIIDRRQITQQEKSLSEIISGAEEIKSDSKDSSHRLDQLIEINQAVRLDKLRNEVVARFIDLPTAERRYCRQLANGKSIKKAEAALYLSAIGTNVAREALEKALGSESRGADKLFLANALADIRHIESLPILINSLIGANFFYRDKVNALIVRYGEAFNSYLSTILNSKRIEIIELIVDFSAHYFSDELKHYLINLVKNMDAEVDMLEKLYGTANGLACKNCRNGSYTTAEDSIDCKYQKKSDPLFWCQYHKQLPVSLNLRETFRKTVYKACTILVEYYPQELDDKVFLNSKDVEIRRFAVQAIARWDTDQNLVRLYNLLGDTEVAESAASTISYLLEGHPAYVNWISMRFMQETESTVKVLLAKILSLRLEYFISKLTGSEKMASTEILRGVIESGRHSEVIDYLNRNQDIDLENEILQVVKSIIPKKQAFAAECQRFLNCRILSKLDLNPIEDVLVSRKMKKDPQFLGLLTAIFFISIAAFPVYFVLRYGALFMNGAWAEAIRLYVFEFGLGFFYYALVIHVVHLTLLLLSQREMFAQVKRWHNKSKSMLFKKRMLPAVSILAPAYNEGRTIVESVNSLLTLQYPNYELVVVNDGSRDDTLSVLIERFDLKRVDYVVKKGIETKPIRGVYLNRWHPKLVVVDKENGGKADALNTGINVSKYEYVCGVDSDSLLEGEALLRLASLTLDEEVETPALGGSVLPVNGCQVERGQIVKEEAPSNLLALFQIVEYVRAFMAGRLGWARINSLLIISGAFGLFRKERLIKVGGYMTDAGKYHKDTVGEDMEIVVRIHEHMCEANLRHRIGFAHNAYCWTEVPEDLLTLKKQRYRWHRGLLEVLFMHKGMLFNPKYGGSGLVAMPYFLIFEVIGPLFEAQGLLALVAALAFGVLPLTQAMLMFVTVILLGTLVSVSSFAIAEKNRTIFSGRNLLKLILFSVAENFGVRQWFALWRVSGYVDVLRKSRGWDKPVRKGFSEAKTE